jgi:hypothetical protein
MNAHDLRERLATLRFLLDNSSFRMGPSYRAEIAEVERQLAAITKA